MPNNNGDHEIDLIRRVLSASADEMFDNLKKDEKLTDSDIEAKEKNDDYEWRKLLKELKATAACYGLSVLGWLISFFLLLLGIVIVRYLSLIWNNPEQISSILSNVLAFLGGAVATICFEAIVKKRL